VGWWWMTAAVAGSLSGWSLDAGGWYVDDAPWLGGDEGSLHLDEAFLFRALDPDGEAAGWVVVGDGRITVDPRDPVGRKALANRLPTPSDARAVVHDDGWVVAADRVVVFGATGELPAEARPLDDLGSAVVFSTDQGRDEVVVSALPRLAVARRKAQEALLDQVAAWTDEVMDPRAPVVLDALAPRDDARWIAGLRVTSDAEVPWRTSRWMRWVHDGSGVLEPGRAAVFRGADQRVLADDPLPRTEEGRRAAPHRLDLTGAGVLAAVRVETGGQAAEVGVAADLQLHAVGGPAAVAVLDIPHTQQRAWYSNPPLPNAWALQSIEDADGHELEVVPLALTPDQREGRGTHRTVVVALAQPLAEGQSTALRVRWRDRRRYAHVIEIDERPFLLDVSTGVVPVLPVVRGDDRAPAPVRLRAGVASEIRKDTVVAAGQSLSRTEPAKGLEWVETETTSAEATVAAGRFRTGAVEGDDGLPDMETYVQVRTDAQKLAASWAFVAKVVDPVVPSWPERMAVVDGDTVYGGPPWAEASGGLMQRHASWPAAHPTGIGTPAGHEVATALLADRWNATEPVGEAQAVAWLGAQLAGWWALQARGSSEDQHTWRHMVHTQAHPGSGRRVHAQHLAYHWLDVGSGGLPEAFGEHAVRQAFTRVLAGDYPASWQGLADALSVASGIDATDYVALWMASGVRPSLDVQWRYDRDTDRLVARVLSDVPYGSMPLTLTVRRGRRQVQVPLSLFDGIARAQIPWTGPAPRRVTVDAGALPLAGATVREQLASR